jgi:peptide/nickel transport system permease protein
MTIMDTSSADVAVAEEASASSRVSLLRRLLHRPLAVVSLSFIAIVVFLTIFAPLIAPYSATSTDLLHTLRGPSSAHWLGTDGDGRDVLSRLMYGGRVSLLGMFIAVATALVIGVPAGLIAGYAGGRWPDSVVSRIGDMLIALPAVIILLCVLAVFPQNEKAAMFALGVLFSAGLMRMVRASTIAVRNDLYVDAARVSGLSQFRLLKRHILPRVKGPIIVMASLMAAFGLIAEAGLGFLGLGVAPPTASWGSMVAEARTAVFQDTWLLVPSGVLIGLMALSFALIGDALTDLSGERASTSRAMPASRRRHRAPVVTKRERPPVPAGALLSVSNLSVAFLKGRSETTVVSSVGFDIAPGEVLGIVGESGCGKSVTAASISNVLPPNGRITSGSVIFEGQELVGRAERELQALRGSGIGFIPQEPMAALDPVFSVGHLLAESVRSHYHVSRADARRRVTELLEMVHLPDPEKIAKRYPHQLSGGMAQRVVIAFALSGGPRLLIADEPTTALDVTVQAEILELLRQLQQQLSMAILVVSHDWGVIADLCDRAVVMYAGQVVECADVADMFRAPHHPYTAGLLASNPHLALDGGKLPTIPGSVPSPDAWPVGCHFNPRCKYASEECLAHEIELTPVGAHRTVRCVHHDEVAIGSPA